MADDSKLDQLCIDTIRTLSIDAVQKANSGHPGTPMGAAPTVYTIWQRFLRYDPGDPQWFGRDRFVLSNGHASAMLYSMLHLAGVAAVAPSYRGEKRLAVELADLEAFRQPGFRTPGHPEHGWTSGVETTTGPLGQGAATSVGMAIASRWLQATYDRPDFDLFGFDVYSTCGDGCLMEGITSEAASLAGHLGLSNLCWVYDDNQITIEGHTNLAFSEDVAARFSAYGWNVLRVPDGNDLDALTRALEVFRRTKDGPTLIIVKTHIGYGAPHRQDTKEAHGEPLGDEEVAATKRFYGWDPSARFLVPPGVREHFAAGVGRRGAEARAAWEERFAAYAKKFPAEAAQVECIRSGGLPEGWDAELPSFPADVKGIASRDASGKVLNALAKRVPWVLGGAADLAPSTKTHLGFPGAGDFQGPGFPGDATGRNFHFGVREHAMAAITNGLVLSGLRAFASGFFIFTDYCRGAIRLSALMNLPVTWVWTHDSISVGEDGPTHQPVEHLASFRAMPNMMVLRPADANEVVEAYRVAMLRRDRPACLVFSRQALPTLDRTKVAPATGLARGGYVLCDAGGAEPKVILIGTGSEVSLCLAAASELAAGGVATRVVSLPSWELFAEQTPEYRESVLPRAIRARVAVEQASTFGWERHVGAEGAILGMHSFGESGPMAKVAKHFGFEVDRVVALAREQIARAGA